MKIFISGTSTDVGKTYISTRISRQLMDRGIVISAIKPIETGAENMPKDAVAHIKNQSYKHNIEDICFYQFKQAASPFVADKCGIIDVDNIKRRINQLALKSQITIIEGAGGLFVPIKEKYFMIDLIKDINAFCILVSDSKLGCINNLIGARKNLEYYGIDSISIVNVFDEISFMETSYPYIKKIKNNFIYQNQENEIIDFIIEKMQQCKR